LFKLVKKLGPGLLFAGAAIGVSHLVQATRAGASYGYGLLWALLLIHAIKYPFFQFAPRYTTATGESIIDGYKRLGKGVLVFYFILTLATMFTIQAAVTMVTAGLAAHLFGITSNVLIWVFIIIISSVLFLFKGRYDLLDKFIKVIIVLLTVASIVAVVVAGFNSNTSLSLLPSFPKGAIEVTFLIAFLGWMPAPLDVSVWQSLWTQEKQKELGETFSTKQSIFDFNIGYIGTIITGILFMSLGALVLFNSGETLSPKAGVFAKQLIELYSTNLGKGIGIIVGIAAFTTMLSTTITALDASPRAMAKTVDLLLENKKKQGSKQTRFRVLLTSSQVWLLVLALGTLFVLSFLTTSMGVMIKIATIISFLTAPFYAIANFWLVSSKHTPADWRPSLGLKIWSFLGVLFLIGFSFWYLSSLFFL